MELLLLVFFCLLTGSDVTFGAVTRVRVEVGSDVTLTCSPSTKEDVTSQVFVWRKDGRQEVFFYNAGIHSNNGQEGQDQQFIRRVDYFKDKLTSGNASITIRNTKEDDSGIYICEFPKLQSSQIFIVDLVVERPDVNVKAPQPFVRILDQTKGGTLLQCEVQGAFPKPELHWEDEAGNKLPAEEPEVTERGGRYNIILQTTVTRTDAYRCVVTQKEINRQTHAEIYVFIPGFTGGQIAGIVISLLLLLLLLAGGILAVLRCLGCIIQNFSKVAAKPSIKILEKTKDKALLQCEVRRSFPKPELHWEDRAGIKLPVEEIVESKSGGRYSVIKATVNKTGDYYCVVTQKKNNHKIYAGIHVDIPGSTPPTDNDIGAAPPSTEAEKTVIRVEEGSDVTLPCSLSTKEDITSERFEWRKDSQVFLYDGKDHSNNTGTGQDQQFKGRVQHFPDKLKSGDASITIRDIKEADSGVYSCEFPDHPGQIFPVQLDVGSTPPTDNDIGAAPPSTEAGEDDEEVRIPLMPSNGDQPTADTRV